MKTALEAPASGAAFFSEYRLMSHPLISHPLMSHPLMSHPLMSHPLMSHPPPPDRSDCTRPRNGEGRPGQIHSDAQRPGELRSSL